MSTTEDTNATRRGSGSNDGLGLVERLRHEAWHTGYKPTKPWDLLVDAADEIERLRIQVRQADERGDEAMRRAHAAEAEIERLRGQLADAQADYLRLLREKQARLLGMTA